MSDTDEREPLMRFVSEVAVCSRCTLPSERGGDPMRVCGRHADLLSDLCSEALDAALQEGDDG